MVHNGTLAAAICLGKPVVIFANQVALRLYVLKEEQIFARDRLSSVLSHAILGLLIAFNGPVIMYITHSIVAEA